MKLAIASDFGLPLESVTQTFAILAKRRVGKTYSASVIAEEMVKAKLPFVALDPTGAWWGLRATPEGKPNNSPVIIIGGEHGDLPLESTAGKVIAELVVDHPGQYVLDLSATTSNAEQDRFVCDFAERLYRRKATAKVPLHLFLDEADAFAPQRPMPGQQRMLGAIEALVRRGGIRGIGVTLITQRPAVLNKNVLTQVECLIVLQINAPQDIAAIDDWVKNNAAPDEREKVVRSLASLQRGQAWFWSPAWLQCLQRVDVRQRHTYNSSATPEVGKGPSVTVTLAPADLDRLRDKIAATIEKAKADDPKELRKQIADLKRQLAASSAIQQPETIIKEVPILSYEDRGALTKHALLATDLAERLTQLAGTLKESLPRGALGITNAPGRVTVQRQIRPAAIQHSESNGDASINKCERSLLSVLAQFPEGCNRRKLILLAGYCWSGSTQNALSHLRTICAIEGDNSGVIRITDAGQAYGPFEPLPEGESLINHWLTFSKFGLCERTLLRCFVEHPNGLERDSLLKVSGYEWSGSTQNALGALRTAEVITGRNNEVMRLSDELLEAIQ